MHNIKIRLPNKYISLSIEEFNNLIIYFFQNNDMDNFIILLELMDEYNKIIFIKNNEKKFKNLLPLCYKIKLALNNIIHFNYKINNHNLPNLNIVPISNSDKKYPNYSLKINNENFLLFKKNNNKFIPLINKLEILDHKITGNNNSDEDILNNYLLNPRIYCYEYFEFYDNILNNILPKILVNSNSVEYFLFFNNQLLLINNFIFNKNKYNKIINILLNIKNIK